MVFSSVFFLFVFLPIVLILYYIAPNRLQNSILLVFSLLFYMWGEPTFVFVMMLSIFLNYLAGLLIHRYEGTRSFSTAIMITGVGLNFLLIAYYKYYNFFVENINATGLSHLPMREIILPVGISFFTFQGLSYVLDVYLKKTPVQRNLLNLALYISFFPQLIAGPIVRYETFEHQIHNRKETLTQFMSGIERFILGLGKKVIIANAVGFAATQVFSKSVDQISTLEGWVGILCFTLQIYFDFSGYSDMAIGLARMFGFEFLENFNYPYISQSISEFWRRWHISLGTWFRDYVYIPLGGNQVNFARGLLNLFIVWFLTGLWHGASWNFIFWGLYFGGFIMAERLFLDRWLKKAHRAFRHVYVLLIVVFGWVFFNSPDLPYAIDYMAVLLGLKGSLINQNGIKLLMEYKLELVLGMFLSMPWMMQRIKAWIHASKESVLKEGVYFTALGGLLLLSTAYIVVDTFNPFIYFRF